MRRTSWVSPTGSGRGAARAGGRYRAQEGELGFRPGHPRLLHLPEQARRLASVVRGHCADYAVPGNSEASRAFRTQAARHWYRALGEPTDSTGRPVPRRRLVAECSVIVTLGDVRSCFPRHLDPISPSFLLWVPECTRRRLLLTESAMRLFCTGGRQDNETQQGNRNPGIRTHSRSQPRKSGLPACLTT
jgi:hypothetical protein